MTGQPPRAEINREQQQAWARVARASAAVAELWVAGTNSREANDELCDVTAAAVLAGVGLREAAEAIRSGWPGLQTSDAVDTVEVFLGCQADAEREQLHRRLAEIARGRA
jgi:hypothetical protein